MATAVDVKKQSEDLEPAAGTLSLYGGGLGHVYGYGSAGLAGPLYASGLGFAGLGGAAGLGYAGVAGFGGAPFAFGGGLPLHYGGGIRGVGLAGYGGRFATFNLHSELNFIILLLLFL